MVNLQPNLTFLLRYFCSIFIRFFRQTKLPSFQRQLNLWGFQKVVNGPDRGGYYHELFMRGRPELAPIMLRVKGCAMEGLKVETNNSVVVEDPDFYAYPYCEHTNRVMTSGAQQGHDRVADRQKATIIVPSTPPDSPRSYVLTVQSPPQSKSSSSKVAISLVTPPYQSRRIGFGDRDDETRWGHERRKIHFQHDIRELHRTFAREEDASESSSEIDYDDDLFEGRTFQTVEECNAQALDSILSLEEEALYAKSVLSEVKRMKMCLGMGLTSCRL